MLQNKSLADFDCVSDEQLFTELTPEEGAVVEGGANLQLRYLFANKPPQNDPIIRVGGTDAFARDNVNTTKSIFKTLEYSGDTTLSIWDADPGLNNDDLIAFVNLGPTPTNGIKFLNGGGYSLSYQVTT